MSDLVKELEVMAANITTMSDVYLASQLKHAAARIEALEAEVAALKPAAGMVVVPREPTGEMLEAGRKAWKKPRLHVNYNPADELMTCGVIYRAMTEAANG